MAIPVDITAPLQLNMVHVGQALTLLKRIPSKSVRCCVTSPPYYKQRDYGVKGQLGQEKSYKQYIRKLVVIFEEVKRILTDDGTLWLNMGDTYTSERTMVQFKIKFKELMGIPWRVAFALQDAGWYLRRDIIWSKPNCMPESVKDRCSTSHEYVFHFSKQRRYYYNHEAIKEPLAQSTVERYKRGVSANHKMTEGAPGQLAHTMHQPREIVNMPTVGGKKHKNLVDKGQKIHGMHRTRNEHGHDAISEDGMANKRSVWVVPTKPFADAHFATFPDELIVPCILAGSEPGDTIIDPFGGSGTTGSVSSKLSRHFILIDLSQKAADVANRRLHRELGLFKPVV